MTVELFLQITHKGVLAIAMGAPNESVSIKGRVPVRLVKLSTIMFFAAVIMSLGEGQNHSQ